MPGWLAAQKAESARLLALSAAAGRAEMAARTRSRFPPSLEALQAEQAARVATSLPSPPPAAGPVRASLPASVLAAAGLRVVNARIWEADVRPIGRRADHETWLGLVRSRARARVRGDVLAPTLARISELLVWDERRSTAGFARMTFDQLADKAMICRETARKAMRWLEGRGLIDTFNVIGRDRSGAFRRNANLYIRRADSAPIAAESAPADRLAARIARHALSFGLRATAWGLNVRQLQGEVWIPREHPSPA